jgi:hypothetical protein
MFDQSHHVTDLLRQISTTKTAVMDLRSQMTDNQSSAAQSHALLETEVDACRQRKRLEDAAQRDIKSRTKALDDSKRAAEASKKETERRLKTAQSTRDGAEQRKNSLNSQIVALRARINEPPSSIAEGEAELSQVLEQKKKETKVAEDVIAALNSRARDLEETLANRKEQLRLLRERSTRNYANGQGNWPVTSSPDHVLAVPAEPEHWAEIALPSPPSAKQPMKLLLGKLSNFHHAASKPLFPIRPSSKDNVLSVEPHSKFSPFSESPITTSHSLATSPSGASLIPTGLINSLDSNTDGLSMSFRSESDMRMDRDWRSRSNSVGETPTAPSAISLHGSPSASDVTLLGDQKPDPENSFRRRWFSSKTLFNPAPGSSTLDHVKTSSYDALNPNGIGSGVRSNTTAADSSLLLRAFAPSPAEREALQRALGGSTNTSLERLPSLSDVGTLPTSSSQLSLHHVPEPSRGMPSWFRSIPRMKSKTTFSPWDDDEEYAQGSKNAA